MNIVAIISFCLVVLNVYLFAYISARKIETKITLYYKLFLLCACIYMAGEFFVYSNNNIHVLKALFKVTVSSSSIILVLLMQFIYELCKRKKRWVWYLSLAVCASTVIATVFTDAIISHVYFQNLYPKIYQGKLYFYFVLPYTIIPAGASLYALIFSYRTEKNNNYKRVLMTFLVLCTVVFTLSFLNEVIFNAFLKIKSIHLAPLFISMQSVIIFVLIKKYNFFSITLRDISDDIFDNLPGGIVILDVDDVIKKCNKFAKKYLGIKEKDFNKTKAADILEDYNSSSGFFFSQTNDANVKYYAIYKSEVSYNHLEVGRILYVLDITELKNTEMKLVSSNKELKKLSKIKDEFVSIVSHDLRSPLGAIKVAASLIEKRESLSDGGKDMLKIILDTVDYQARYVKSLLDIARYKQGDIELEKTNININEVVLSTIDILQLTADKKDINIQADCPEHLYADVDLEKITQVLTNLIGNAIKFTNRGGNIKIKCSSDGYVLKVNVVDNGMGISEEKVKTLFESYSIKSSKGTEGEVGTGMGLYICKIYLRLHGGDIGVCSNSNKKGSDFYFTIPIKSA